MNRNPIEAAAPSSRVSPRRIIAIVVAALFLLGILGLVGAALWGDDGTPTGDGLQRPIDVEAPATADPHAGDTAPASAPEPAPAAAVAPAPPPPTNGAGASSEATSTASGDDFDVDTPATSEGGESNAAPLDAITPLSPSDELPEPSEPVALPGLIAAPAPATTIVATALLDFDPERVSDLTGWKVVARDSGYLRLTNGSGVAEVFILDGELGTADAALSQFVDEMRDDLEIETSPVTRLPAPGPRYSSVAGLQFTAINAGQQGTRTITGSAVSGIETDGSAIVVTASHAGAPSTAQSTTDSDVLTSLLAHIAP